MLFHDRRDAGRQLVRRLNRYAGRSDVVVLALPRGGVPVGYEVAEAIGAPLDVFLVRKLGVPGHEELAMGAIASGGVRVLNDTVLQMYRLPDSAVEQATAEEQRELTRREREYRRGRPPLDVTGKTVILVDDGLATGSTVRAAVVSLRRFEPNRIVVAVPVGSAATCAAVAEEADEAICAAEPDPFIAVGEWYQDFSPTTDDEVKDLLDRFDLKAPVPSNS
jgi:putative phosphoribosyl transferase